MASTSPSPLPGWLRLAGETYLHAPTQQRVVVLDRIYGRRRTAAPRYVVRLLKSASSAPFEATAAELIVPANNP